MAKITVKMFYLFFFFINWKGPLEVSISYWSLEKRKYTSICIFRCNLKFDNNVKKMESESSKTSGTDETPFLDNATQRYCLMAFINISLVLKTGPAFCRIDKSSCSDRTFERNSWDLGRNRKRLDYHICIIRGRKLYTADTSSGY